MELDAELNLNASAIAMKDGLISSQKILCDVSIKDKTVGLPQGLGAQHLRVSRQNKIIEIHFN